ncbi:hypothetical protein KA005_34525, partial [bacterium]|nr:hypothetical protein [bacterium]
MNLNEGLGDVVMKGEKLLYKPSKRITAAYHDNHHDIWLITHENLTDRYYSFLITGDGVTETPVISTVGTMISSTTTGQLKVSPDGSKIVCSYTHDGDGEGFDLFQFNASTGELFNPLTFTTTTRGINGSEFSPDGSILYILQSGSIGEATLFQYDVSEYNYNTIEESRATILHPVYNILEEMQLAPNGKIYFTKGGGDIYGLKHLGAIHAPNRSGTDCDVEENSLYLDGIQNLNPNPNFIQNYFFSNDFIFDNSCLGDSIYFQIVSTDQVDSVLWKFGDGNQSNEYNPIYLYSAPGDYQVQLISFYPNFIDTVKKNVQVYELP